MDHSLPARHVKKASLAAGATLPDFTPGVERRSNWFRFGDLEVGVGHSPMHDPTRPERRARRNADLDKHRQTLLAASQSEPAIDAASEPQTQTTDTTTDSAFGSHFGRMEIRRRRRRRRRRGGDPADEPEAQQPGMRVPSSRPVFNELLVELPPMDIPTRHPLGLCLRCGQGAELCLRCANMKQYEEITCYKEARAHGAVYLFNKAILRGHESLLAIVFRMWRNGLQDRRVQDARMETIIRRWQKRQMWVPFAKWLNFVQIQRRKRTTEYSAKLELENESLRNRLEEVEQSAKELQKEVVSVRQQVHEVQELERKKTAMAEDELRKCQTELAELKTASGTEELLQQKAHYQAAAHALMEAKFVELEEALRALDVLPRAGVVDVHTATSDRSRAMIELRDEPPRNVVRARLPKDAASALDVLKPNGLGQYAPVDRVIQLTLEWTNALLREVPAAAAAEGGGEGGGEGEGQGQGQGEGEGQPPGQPLPPLASLTELASVEHYPVIVEVLLRAQMVGEDPPPHSALVAAACAVAAATNGRVTEDDIARFRTQVAREPEAVERAALVLTTTQRWFNTPPELVTPEELVSQDVAAHVRLLSTLYMSTGARFRARDELVARRAEEVRGMREQWDTLRLQDIAGHAEGEEDLVADTRLAADIAALARVFSHAAEDVATTIAQIHDGHALWVRTEKVLLRNLVVDMATRMRGLL